MNGHVFVPLSTIFLLDFRNVPTEWYYLFFSFYSVSYAQCSPCLLSSSPVLSGIANFVLLHVFNDFGFVCHVRYDCRMKTIFGSSLPLVVC